MKSLTPSGFILVLHNIARQIPVMVYRAYLALVLEIVVC